MTIDRWNKTLFDTVLSPKPAAKQIGSDFEKKYGSQHGSGHEYDNHIPLIFYGNNIPAETRNEKVYIVDIAATITDFIGVNKPSDCIGIPLLINK